MEVSHCLLQVKNVSGQDRNQDDSLESRFWSKISWLVSLGEYSWPDKQATLKMFHLHKLGWRLHKEQPQHQKRKGRPPARLKPNHWNLYCDVRFLSTVEVRHTFSALVKASSWAGRWRKLNPISSFGDNSLWFKSPKQYRRNSNTRPKLTVSLESIWSD